MKPVLFAFVAAAFWGLWWIPVRWLAGHGLDGAMGGLVMNAGAGLACLIWLLVRRDMVRIDARGWIGAILVGVAFTTYSVALNYSDVARVILLFYLAPAWSKIIERVFFGMPWAWTSTLALGAGFAGAALLIGGQVAGGAVNIGDAIAVLSGLSWAAGAALIFSSGRVHVLSLSWASLMATVLVSLLFLAVDGTPWPGPGAVTVSLGAMAVGAVYVLPVMFLTLWSAQRLPPATLSFLLTAEVLFGTGSAAILLEEPFGPVQMAGAALILMAATTEVLFRRAPVQPQT